MAPTPMKLTDEQLIETAASNAEWLSGVVKTGDNGVHTVAKTDFVKFAEREGVTRDTLEAVRAVENRLVDAQHVFLRGRVIERVKAAKDAGEAPTGITEELRVTTIAGTQTLRMHAQETFPVPTREGEPAKPPVVRLGRTELRIRSTYTPTSPLVQATAQLLEEALKG